MPASRWITPRRIVFVLLLVALLFAARSCQQSQVRISQERAVALAREQVRFTPDRTQVRLVRQGLTSRPYWAISMSVPKRSSTQVGGEFRRLAVVRVDANTGKVVAVTYPNRPVSGG
jgi:hypothetical protein